MSFRKLHMVLCDGPGCYKMVIGEELADARRIAATLEAWPVVNKKRLDFHTEACRQAYMERLERDKSDVTATGESQ